MDHFSPYCVFCSIIQRTSPATIFYEDEDVIVFKNVLRWVPVMLLTVPKRHMSQVQLWSDPGSLLSIAHRMGQEHAPEGFQLLSNFGGDAMQSQPHAHVHVVGGAKYLQGPCPFCGEVAGQWEAPEGWVLEQVKPSQGWSFVPIALRLRPAKPLEPERFWREVVAVSARLVDLGVDRSPWGFRLIGHVWPSEDGDDPAVRQPHLHLLGGTFLGEYA